MYINLIPDNSIASAPSGLTAVVQAAARYYDQLCPGNYTVNISYGWGTYDNQAYAPLTTNSGDFSVGGFDWSSGTSYSQLKEWLTSSAITTDQITAVQSLPASSASLPGGANGFGVSNAEKKALGVYAGPNGVVDGSIGFNTGDSAADFNAADPTYLYGGYDPALVEIFHALGWLTGYAAPDGTPSPLDLFRYSSPGNLQWTGGQPAYFSIDGGKTDLANFATSFDYSLFTNPSMFSSDGSGLSVVAKQVLNVLGFTTPLPIYYPPNFIDLQNFEAGYRDLINAFGENRAAMQSWYNTYEPT